MSQREEPLVFLFVTIIDNSHLLLADPLHLKAQRQLAELWKSNRLRHLGHMTITVAGYRHLLIPESHCDCGIRQERKRDEKTEAP